MMSHATMIACPLADYKAITDHTTWALRLGMGMEPDSATTTSAAA